MLTRSKIASAVRGALRAGPRRLGAAGAAAWLLGTLVHVPVARAQEHAMVLRLRAERLVTEGKCGEAVPVLRRARELEPENARTALLEGECSVQLHRYAEALAPLEMAKRLDPSLSEADLFLTIAHYHLGNYARARRSLEVAQANFPERAETQLYGGLLLLQRAEAETAAVRLEHAVATNPDYAEPAASYYAGLAWESAGERERAAHAFERVRADAPGTPWAQQADAALSRMKAEPRRYWLSAMAGLEYDSNVALLGGGVQLPQEISSADDGRGVWSLAGAYEFFRQGPWSAGISGNYYGTGNFQVNEYDWQSPGTGVWVERSLDAKTLLRVQGDFTYSWLDLEDYVWTAGTTTSAFRVVGEAGLLSGWFRYARNDFQFQPSDAGGPPGIDASKARNRDGDGFDDLTLGTAGFRYQRYDSEGSEYQYNAYRFGLGVVRALPWKITADLSASFEYRPYDNPSTFQDPPGSGGFNPNDRDEKTWRVNLMIQRPITSLVTASLVYSYYNNDSNVMLYDYDRNIVGLRFTVSLPR
jgi:tetratricopeptide (TPR) repeat protein